MLNRRSLCGLLTVPFFCASKPPASDVTVELRLLVARERDLTRRLRDLSDNVREYDLEVAWETMRDLTDEHLDVSRQIKRAVCLANGIDPTNGPETPCALLTDFGLLLVEANTDPIGAYGLQVATLDRFVDLRSGRADR